MQIHTAGFAVNHVTPPVNMWGEVTRGNLLAIIFSWATTHPKHSWSGQPPVDRVKTMLNAVITIQTDPALQGKNHVAECQARIKEAPGEYPWDRREMNN